jgi:hypothetical protein
MRTRIVVLIALLVGGCATPEQIAYRRQMEAQQRQAEEQAYIQGLANRCSQFGFSPGHLTTANA